MKFGDYLFENGEEEKLDLTDKLLLMDSALMQIHQSGLFVTSNLLDAYIVDDKILPESIRCGKPDESPDGLEKAQAQDLMELSAIGICAYNRFGEKEGFPKYFVEPSFVDALISSSAFLEQYLTKEGMPDESKDYYRTIFTLLQFKYMNNYFEELKKGGKGSARVLQYSTPAGRAFAQNNENPQGFTVIVAIPIVLAITYILTMLVIVIARNI